MRATYRPLPAAFALVAAFGVTCKDSSAPTVAPQTLVAVGGDNQLALTGDSLPSPLVVRVTGSDGQRFRGASVTWTVTGGAATVGSPTVTSDSLGFAATTVLLGDTPGLVSVQASVVGLQPANFTATACDHPAIGLPDTVSGALATTDCRFNGFYTDFFELTVPAGGGGLTLTMTAAAFDAWLELYRGSGAFVAYDDDIDPGVNINSQITAIVAPGDYLLAPSSYDPNVVGAYSLSAVAGQAELAGCGVVWVMRGVAVSDSVTAGDCVDTTGGGTHYSDVVAVFLEAGSVLTVLHQSTVFDAALFLRDAAGILVASNNDSAAGTINAHLVHPVLQTGAYLLFAGTNNVAATGPYTLTISASTTLSGSARAERGRAVLRMAPLRMPKGLPRRVWSR